MLLYGAAGTHFLLALWAVYDRRTFRLPPAELLRIALGFTLPIILIGHAANTRLAWELFELPSDYKRVVSTAPDSRTRRVGSSADGAGLAARLPRAAIRLLSRRAWFRRKLRYVLFAFALLIPVFSGLGFIAMARELAPTPPLPPPRWTISGPSTPPNAWRWCNGATGSSLGYFGIIGATFAARAVRNALERGRRHLITISYPGRTVRVPRGWSVLEASRSFHLPHASMCGGRARCSTCRVRVSAGEAACPPAAPDERATLDRIGAPPDVRLACQLRPEGDLSVIPLVRTERPNYRPTAPRRSAEREVVVLYCDFLNRAELAADHMPQDLLYVLTLYIDGLSNCIRSAHGAMSYVELDSLCALFGLERAPARAARQALQAAGAIEKVMTELNERLGRQWNCKVTLAVSIHLGRAVVGEVGATDPPTVIAIGEAVDAANELRKAAAARGAAFAISQAVYAAAGVEPPPAETIMVAAPTAAAAIPAVLSASAPVLPAPAALGREPRAALQRLLGQ